MSNPPAPRHGVSLRAHACGPRRAHAEASTREAAAAAATAQARRQEAVAAASDATAMQERLRTAREELTRCDEELPGAASRAVRWSVTPTSLRLVNAVRQDEAAAAAAQLAAVRVQLGAAQSEAASAAADLHRLREEAERWGKMARDSEARVAAAGAAAAEKDRQLQELMRRVEATAARYVRASW